MTKTEYVNDLIERLGNKNLRPGLSLPPGVIYQSSLTIASEARDEAYELADPDLIEPLKIRLEKEKNTSTRIDIIRLLVRIADRVNDHPIADYILATVRLEKVRWIQDVALESLAESKLEIWNEKEYLFELIQHKHWRIKMNALNLLTTLDSTYSPRIEDFCLTALKSKSTKPNELSWFCNVLSRHGSDKSLDVLKEIARTSDKYYIVNAAASTIAAINGKGELAFFAEILDTNKNNYVKSNQTSILCQFGDDTVVDPLIKRSKAILSKARKTSVTYVGRAKPELVHICEFLLQHRNAKVEEFLYLVKNKKYNMMDETEKKWFDTHITFV
ncbi:HEAT repeat domain-containing protein [Cytophagaceae bacterium YF14B1]|uniref:HEAT repeat domain-containing protein n=1 Tax=Xanthocytophaga flava TaxID=3048013 RepID=A0AAE3U9J5_9BACT|nr:HEAT repeat domain-containing protein [Xanthocytophaga flavus]MDJ1481789.1 HEAT repeat domain-containing protein [Xanthocytophaga flavus]